MSTTTRESAAALLEDAAAEIREGTPGASPLVLRELAGLLDRHATTLDRLLEGVDDEEGTAEMLTGAAREIAAMLRVEALRARAGAPSELPPLDFGTGDEALSEEERSDIFAAFALGMERAPDRVDPEALGSKLVAALHAADRLAEAERERDRWKEIADEAERLRARAHGLWAEADRLLQRVLEGQQGEGEGP